MTIITSHSVFFCQSLFHLMGTWIITVAGTLAMMYSTLISASIAIEEDTRDPSQTVCWNLDEDTQTWSARDESCFIELFWLSLWLSVIRGCASIAILLLTKCFHKPCATSVLVNTWVADCAMALIFVPWTILGKKSHTFTPFHQCDNIIHGVTAITHQTLSFCEVDRYFQLYQASDRADYLWKIPLLFGVDFLVMIVSVLIWSCRNCHATIRQPTMAHVVRDYFKKHPYLLPELVSLVLEFIPSSG